MAKTLAQIQALVDVKLNLSGTSNKRLHSESDVAGYINEAIFHIANKGHIELLEGLKTQTDITPVSGKITKPNDYYRFWYARIDSRNARLISPEEIDEVTYDTYKAPGDKNKYLYDYSGTQFQVLPTNANSVEFHYIKKPSVLVNSSDVSALTETADYYVVELAAGFAMQAKGHAPEEAIAIINRIERIIQ